MSHNKRDIYVAILPYVNGTGERIMGIKGDKTKELICREAYGLFARMGFKDVTMQNICERTGLSRGGLYRHYESTGQIFQEIMTKLLDQQGDEFAEKIRNHVPAVSILNDVLARYEEEMIDSDHSLSIAIYEYFSSHNATGGGNSISRQYEASKEMWVSLLSYGMETGEFKQAEPEAVFDLIVFSYQGVRMYSRLMPVDRDTPIRITGLIKKILIEKGR